MKLTVKGPKIMVQKVHRHFLKYYIQSFVFKVTIFPFA